MPQQQSPWLETAYGWAYGENGWNTGMDSNLLKFSVMFDRNIDSIVASLPPAVNGQVHYNTTDNRIYFAVNTSYFSTPVPKWFIVVVRSTGVTWQYNGTSLVEVQSAGSLGTRLDAVELTLSSLGSAAFEDVSAFATQSALDVVEGQAQAYTDSLRQDLYVVSVHQYTGTPNGINSNQAGIEAAVSAALAAGSALYWPVGTYVSDANIPNFHAIRHVGSGVIKRGAETFKIHQAGGQLNKLYVSPSGATGNDGLSASEPMAGIQEAVNALATRSRLEGRWQVIGAGGVYSEAVSIPDGLAQGANYLEFKFPADPGIRGEPGAWPVGGAILDGAVLSGTGFNVGQYNKVYVEYLLVRNWFNTALPATSQVVSGMTVGRFSLLFAYGVSGFGNGWQNIYVQPRGAAVITGGVLDGARYVVDNTGGRLSFTANASTYTILRNGLEYGIYAKHDGSTVCDFTRFINCGQAPAASEYGAAIFAYKSGTSVDTRQCVFENNNICYHSRSGGHIATDIPSTDVLGSGPTANDRIWKITGFGNNDAVNYRSLAGRDLCRQFSGGSTSSATTVNISGLDDVCTIPAQYFQNADQYLEIEITGSASGGTATVRPTWVSDEPTNYSFGVFTVASNTRFRIRLLIYPTGASAQFFSFDNVGATSVGATLGTSTSTTPFGDRSMTFRVRGEITSGSLVIDRVRVVLWG